MGASPIGGSLQSNREPNMCEMLSGADHTPPFAVDQASRLSRARYRLPPRFADPPALAPQLAFAWNLRSGDPLVSIDAIRFALERDFTADEWRALKAAAGRELRHPEAIVEWARRGPWRFTWNVTRPTAALLELFASYRVTYRMSAIEIALDIPVDGPRGLVHLRSAMKTHLVVRLRRVPQVWRDHATLYWAPRSSTRNLALYIDHGSKFDLGPHVHLDLRLRGVAALRRYGIYGIESLRPERLTAVLRENLRFEALSDSGPLADAIEAAIEREAKATAWAERRAARLAGPHCADDPRVASIAARADWDARARWARLLFNIASNEGVPDPALIDWSRVPLQSAIRHFPDAIRGRRTNLGNDWLLAHLRFANCPRQSDIHRHPPFIA